MTQPGENDMLLPKKIWILEDMEDLWPVYDNALSEDHFILKYFPSFDNFARVYDQHEEKDYPDLILADITLVDDTNFFQKLNESDLTLSTPYMIVSNSKDIETIRMAFEAGAIDYLIKPINENELIAKAEKHLMYLQEKNNETSKSLEALNLDLSAFTNKEIRIIESFNIKEEKTLYRSEIVKLIWKNINIHPNTLDVHIYNLRKKLKPFNYGIKSIGNGLFKFIAIES